VLVAAVVKKTTPQIDLSGDRLYLEHPNAADKDAIIQWTLEEFSRLKIDKKILLLQYGGNFAELGVLNEREKILQIANALSLNIVDTVDVLTRDEPKKLWISGRLAGHHTPYGNQIVCEYLFQRGFH
jgi:hypothetical protein